MRKCKVRSIIETYRMYKQRNASVFISFIGTYLWDRCKLRCIKPLPLIPFILFINCPLTHLFYRKRKTGNHRLLK
ncbi:MAG: DUF2933 domain-containing protein [Lachnospiraceae bacterium]|nr:DUF2933 domain-containing protein [Lachnospiraceae bacterium]